MNKRILANKKKYEGMILTNNKLEEFIVLEYKSSTNVKIKFTKTGTIKTIASGNMLAGKVLDEQTLKKNIVGKIIRNTIGLEYCVIAQDKNDSLIRFRKTKYQRWVSTTEAISGKITDRLYPSIYKEGYLGNQDWNIPYYVKGKNLWKGMLRRCYSPDFRPDAEYEKPIVSERWKDLSIFLDDIQNLKNFDKWLNNEPMHLDKDLIGNSLLYDKTTCLFLTPKENRNEQTIRYKKK